MKHIHYRSIVLLLCVAFTSFAGSEESLVLLSFDGSRPDYFNIEQSPNLVQLGESGWHGTLKSVFPSESFPNHATLITGCYTDQHGIVSNQFSDSKRGVFEYSMDPSWMNCEPVWVTAQKSAGIKTAVTYWPLHGQGAWNGMKPTYQQEFETKDIRKIIHFDDAEKIKSILAWLALPIKERPQFVFSWFADIDTAGHEHGPNSNEVKMAVKKYDALLGVLMDGIKQLPEKDLINVIVVSDHGMAEMNNEVNASAIKDKLVKSGIDEKDFVLQVSGTNARIYLDARATKEMKPLIVKLLKNLGDEIKAFDVYTKGNIPRRFHHRDERTGDILLVGRSGFYFKMAKDSQALIADVRGKGVGKHGYDPENEEMKAVFFAAGPSFTKKKAPVSLRMVDVAPLIRKILQVK